MTPVSKEDRLKHLTEEITNCCLCALAYIRNTPVIGVGSLNSIIMFIGEAPGRKEDEKGEPFVGSAGKLFEQLLHKIGLDRKGVYISNLVKCRPPNNRRPRSMEIKACKTYLERQLELIKPKIIVPMGNSAVSCFLKHFGLNTEPIGKIHGIRYDVETYWGKVILFPVYHPAAAIYRRVLEPILEQDYEKLRIIMQKLSRR